MRNIWSLSPAVVILSFAVALLAGTVPLKASAAQSSCAVLQAGTKKIRNAQTRIVVKLRCGRKSFTLLAASDNSREILGVALVAIAANRRVIAQYNSAKKELSGLMLKATK